MTRLKRVATLSAGGTPPVDDLQNWSDDLDVGTPWVSIGDMSDGAVVAASGRRVSDAARRGSRLPLGERGTLLFAMYASVGAVAELGICATWNQALLGITARPGLSHSPFLRYWLEHLRRDLPALVRSNTQDNLNADQVGNFPFPDLAVSTQRAIADFLDRETARIDTLIAKKRRMLDVLDERKTAVMLAAAAGELSVPELPRVPASLPWLPSRPESWREVLIRLVARTGSGHTPSREKPEWWENCTIPWITTGEVAQIRSDEHEVISETRECISEIGLSNSAAVLHLRGTVVLCRTASAGYSAIMGTDMATSQDFATWTCGPQLRSRFLLLCLRAMRPDLLGRLATGSTHKTIYMPDIHALRIPLPSVEEQDRAVAAAEEQLTRVFGALDRLSRQIELLQEHRQALITAAVTGGLEVPGVAA